MPSIAMKERRKHRGADPRWIIKQHELDILLTTALLDGAALQWQSLSPNTVNTIRRVFFKSLSRNIELDRIFAGNNVAEKEHLRATKHIFECATTVTNRLVALQFLPVPGFLPPIGSYLPEENIRMDSKIEIFSPSVLHHFKTLMLSQPKIGLFIWKDLIQAIGSHSKSNHSKLQAVGVQLIAQCLLDQRNSLVLFFLQCLLPPKKCCRRRRSS